MDHIDQHLITSALNSKYHPAIQATLSVGKKLLNKYYTLTDQLEVYRIAMILHPSHKLEYFRNAGWQDEWITTASEVLKDKFERSYASIEIPDSNVDQPESAPKSDNIFNNLPTLSLANRNALADEIT